MPVETNAKKANWIRRVVADGIAVVDAIRRADVTASEYSTSAFNGGDQANRPEYAITDEDLVAAGFPHLDASKLNQFVGGLAGLKTAYDGSAGILEAARP
ncbi:hypothetical protein J0H58_29515 [bacterium]|nr:hypothetical protein [bacterium]